ncbi:unnamed protein product [Ectocarpus sp. 12 AP-2014]
MFGGPNNVLIAAMALLSMGHVSSQCTSAHYVWWYPCGSNSNSISCDEARIFFNIHREANCVSSNPIVTVDFTGPIVTRGNTYGGNGIFWGDVSDDQFSLTFDMGEVDPIYEQSDDFYYWEFVIYLDNCDTSYTWGDNFVQLSYVDDEQNTTDLSAFEDPNDIDEPDTGICPTPSPAAPSPATPAPVTDATPAPTPTPTADDSGPLALGCYEDDRENRIMDDLALSDNSMTTELCELTCLGHTYFATQYGRECWCGSAGANYASHGESTDCTYACAGDADRTCGGFDAANVYLYTGDDATLTSTFVGCYQDESDARIMELALTDSSSMTKEMCEAECTGNTYFGMQYGRECFCGGSSTDLLQHGESTACDYECPGDSDQSCGGLYAMSVYSYP